MRISTNQIYDLSVKHILDNEGALSNVQQQLSSGKKLLRPSDDPVGAAQVIRLTESLDKITQYKANTNLLKNSLQQEDVVMQNMNSAIDRARQLTINAGDGVLAGTDRQAIASEIKQIRGQVFDLMNTRDSAGQYIFAGSKSHQPAFIYDASASGNKYIYQGDEAQNEIQISPTVRVKDGDSGKAVFENVDARKKSSIVSSTASSASVKVSQQDQYDTFFNKNYDKVNTANNNYQISIIAPGNKVSVVNTGTGANLGTFDYTSGKPLEFKGLQFSITGNVGDSVNFQLDPPQKKNIADTLNDLYHSLNDPNISDGDLSKALADALVGMDNAKNTLSSANSEVGGRLNVADSVNGANLDLEISNKTAKSSIDEVDYAQAVTELSKQENALQAAQATFSKVTKLSLFNYI